MKGPLIILVEAECSLREANVQALQNDGYSVQGYRNGRDSLNTLTGTPRPCLIVLDWMMPVLPESGFTENSRRTVGRPPDEARL